MDSTATGRGESGGGGRGGEDEEKEEVFFLANIVIAEYFYHRVTNLVTTLFPGFLGSLVYEYSIRT